MSQNEQFLASCLRNMLFLLQLRDQTLSYRNTVRQESKASLLEMTSRLEGGDVTLEREYIALLLKKVVLTSFEVLYASVEVIQEVKYSYAELKDILVSVEQFNHQFFKQGRCCQAIELSSLIDVYLKSRVMCLASSLSKKPSSDTLLRLVQFEKGLCAALLAMIATYTSLLNTSDKDVSKRRQFISAEVFSLNLSPDNITWSDCLVPGVQSETLKACGADILSRLWNRVAENLVARATLMESWTMELLLPWLHTASQYTDLETFPIVASCLKHVSSTCLQQLSLTKWDADFRKCLASDNAKYRKGYKLAKNDSPNPVTLCSSSLDEYMSEQVKEMTHITCHSPNSIASHVNILRHTLPLCYALEASLCHTTFVLLQNLSSSMSSWNLGSLGWLLFRDIPLARCSVSSSMALLYGAISPRVSFPVYSGLHSLECSCRAVCSSLHKTSTGLQETLEGFYSHFQSMWACRCSELLKSIFPKIKRWKNIRNKGQYRMERSSYCDILIEQLLVPVTDAAVRLPHGEQKCFVYLTITVFFGEFRRIITSNKKLYSVYAGRQLLADFRYFERWLTSNQQLSKATLQVLSELPIAMEIKKGLLTICGTADVEETDSGVTPADGIFSVAKGLHHQFLLPSRNFPALNEIAWNTMKDWQESMA